MSDAGTLAAWSMDIMSVMDRETEVLLRLAVAIAQGDEARTAERSREAVAAGIGALWVDELLLQSAQVIGYPRTLVGAKVWRETTGIMAPEIGRAHV